MGAGKKRRALQETPYTVTPAQETMRADMEAGRPMVMGHRLKSQMDLDDVFDREPVKLSTAVDELFFQMRGKVIESEADRRYPESVLAPENEQRSDDFIAGAEWWASYGA